MRDIDLTLRAGKVIALVDENGSGKSILGKLLPGLYLPTEGMVTWNGIDLSTVDAWSVHFRIALIAQQPPQWPMTAKCLRRGIGCGVSDSHTIAVPRKHVVVAPPIQTAPSGSVVTVMSPARPSRLPCATR